MSGLKGDGQEWEEEGGGGGGKESVGDCAASLHPPNNSPVQAGPPGKVHDGPGGRVRANREKLLRGWTRLLCLLRKH